MLNVGLVVSPWLSHTGPEGHRQLSCVAASTSCRASKRVFVFLMHQAVVECHHTPQLHRCVPVDRLEHPVSSGDGLFMAGQCLVWAGGQLDTVAVVFEGPTL